MFIFIGQIDPQELRILKRSGIGFFHLMHFLGILVTFNIKMLIEMQGTPILWF